MKKIDEDYLNIDISKEEVETIEEIKENFLSLKDKGPVISVKPEKKNNAGAVGNTFEREMKVDENNRPGPDFKGWEFKTKRQISDSASSLFTQKPSNKGGDEYMRLNWGVSRSMIYDQGAKEYVEVMPDEGDGSFPPMHVLRTRVFNTKFRSYYEEGRVLRAFNDYPNKKYRIHLFDSNNNLIDDKIYFDFASLKEKSEGKLKNTVLCEADEIEINGKIYFQYQSLQVFMGFRFENLLTCLEDGIAVYEHRHGRYKSGDKVGLKHNHGGGFRLINSKYFPRLFDGHFEI